MRIRMILFNDFFCFSNGFGRSGIDLVDDKNARRGNLLLKGDIDRIGVEEMCGIDDAELFLEMKPVVEDGKLQIFFKV